MERTEAHDFYLLKLKKKLEMKEYDLGMDVLEKEETDQYRRIGQCWMPDDLIQYIAPSFSGLSKKLDWYGINLITKKEDAEKLLNVCDGWIKIFREIDEYVRLSEWETKFQKKDLLEFMTGLRELAQGMVQDRTCVICYLGI